MKSDVRCISRSDALRFAYLLFSVINYCTWQRLKPKQEVLPYWEAGVVIFLFLFCFCLKSNSRSFFWLSNLFYSAFQTDSWGDIALYKLKPNKFQPPMFVYIFSVHLSLFHRFTYWLGRRLYLWGSTVLYQVSSTAFLHSTHAHHNFMPMPYKFKSLPCCVTMMS